MENRLEIERARKSTQVALASSNVWYFVKHIACTWDSHDPTTLSKPFPNKAMYRIICRAYDEFQILFIEKSRQIMMSWIMATILLWDAMTKLGRLHLLQSKRQDDADLLIDRATHVYRTCLEYGIPWIPKAKMVGEKIGTTTELSFPSTKSELRSIPQGPDIVRSNTCSAILADEMNHQPEFSEGYAAAYHTIHGGGKYIAQGTANGRTAAYYILHGIDRRTRFPLGPHLVDSTKCVPPIIAPEGLSQEARRRWIDRYIAEMPEEEFRAVPFAELVASMPGMRYWRTAAGINCLRVHYSADPDKSPDTEKGREFIRVGRAGTGADEWEREMEISYDSMSGCPVIPQFSYNHYVKRLEYDDRFPIDITMDFGKNCCALFGQVVQVGQHNVKQARLLDEIYLENVDTVTLVDQVVAKLQSRYRRAWQKNNVRAYCDPAGNQTKETTSDKSLNSSVKICNASGLYPFSKMFGIPDSVSFISAIFSRILPNGEPAILVDEGCEYIIKALLGGWHYPEATKGREGYPDKDGVFEHGGDTLRYWICNTFDEFDASGQPRDEIYRPPQVFRRTTGERLGVRRVNRSRGQHLVRG